MCLTNRMNKYYYIESFRFFSLFYLLLSYSFQYNDWYTCNCKSIANDENRKFWNKYKIVSDCEPSVKIHFYSTSVFFCTSSYFARVGKIVSLRFYGFCIFSRRPLFTHVRQLKEIFIEIDSETFPDVIRLRGKTSS